MKQVVAVVCAVLFLCASAIYAIRSGTFSKPAPALTLSTTRTIVFDGNSFTPAALVVRVGDTVTFQNSSQSPFWPASNLHPSHGEYSEFDPKQPVAAGSSWKFTFGKPGVHRYHDHLASTMVGTVTVLAEGATSVAPLDCAAPGADRTECWRQELETILKDKGLDAAYTRLAELYAAEPAFAKDCHSYTHLIGEKAFANFEADHDFLPSALASYCGYGFYHGFMETLLKETGDLAEARRFCSTVGKKLSSVNGDAEGACYHGFGHGVVDGSDPRTKGNVAATIDPGLSLCAQVSPTEQFLNRCASGVYNSLAILYQDPQYQLPLDRAHPFAICAEQKTATYRLTCYEQMNTLALWATGGDFKKAAADAASVSETEYAAVALESLASWAAHAELTGPVSGIVSQCREVPDALFPSCINGFAAGYVEFGPPEREHERALALCADPGVPASVKPSCYRRVLWLTSNSRGAAAQSAVCATVPQQFREYCPSSN